MTTIHPTPTRVQIWQERVFLWGGAAVLLAGVVLAVVGQRALSQARLAAEFSGTLTGGVYDDAGVGDATLQFWMGVVIAVCGVVMLLAGRKVRIDREGPSA